VSEREIERLRVLVVLRMTVFDDGYLTSVAFRKYKDLVGSKLCFGE